MKLPERSASTDEIIEFLVDINFEIHNTILEDGDYYSLIDDLIEADIGNHCYAFSDATTALHVSKTRIYADQRDVTHEANHVYLEMSYGVSSDLGRLILEGEDNEKNSQEEVFDYLDLKYKEIEIIPTGLANSALHLWNLDYLKDFPINAGNPVKGTVEDLKRHIRELEKSYLKTMSAIYLPLDVLTTAERKILRTTPHTEEIELLIGKIFANWDKRKNGVVNSIPSARVIPGTSQYTINRHLESLGIYRKQYHRFIKEQTLPTKKLALGMALYFAPNNFEWIEQFMNVFGYSISSNIMAITEENICTTKSAVILDRDIRKILNSGLDSDIILMLLSEKSRKVKKSSSSKNFS